MKDKEPYIIILVLFILIGLAYSPIKKESLNKSSSRADTSAPSALGEPDGRLGSSSNKEIAKDIKDTERSVQRLERNVDEKIEESKRSPYYGKVSMSYISGLYQNDPNREYIRLYTDLSINETINITGWYLKSEVTGYYAVIGKAAILPFPFTNTESDIVLQQGDRVYLTKGFSPIGISFRTNKCTGYFEENRTFTPSLPMACPRAADENLPQFSSVYDRNDECLDILDTISRCTTKGSAFLRDLPDTVPQACKNYIKEQLNYNACVANHYSDTDFPGREYRVYLKKFGPLWRQRSDKINLYDENNLVVSTISY